MAAIRILPKKQRRDADKYDAVRKVITIKSLKDDLHGYYAIGVDDAAQDGSLMLVVTEAPMQSSEAFRRDGYGNILISLFNHADCVKVNYNCLVDIKYNEYDAVLNAYVYSITFRELVQHSTRSIAINRP
jgi:hypothetical protein